MGHRALIAYERPDSTYNLHYSHWGALHLRLKHAITAETSYGQERPDESLTAVFYSLIESDPGRGIDQSQIPSDLPGSPVDVEPRARGLTIDEIITEHLDYLHHEAFYVVAQDFDVTAYRSYWFGFQDDCVTIDEGPTIGNGAIRTVRWYEDEPVGDGFAQGEFRALKNVAGDLVDREIVDHETALDYLEAKLAEWVSDDQELILRRP